MLQIKVPFLPMSAWLPKVVEPSKQQVLAAVFFLILYPYYLIRGLAARHKYLLPLSKAPCVIGYFQPLHPYTNRHQAYSKGGDRSDV